MIEHVNLNEDLQVFISDRHDDFDRDDPPYGVISWGSKLGKDGKPEFSKPRIEAYTTTRKTESYSPEQLKRAVPVFLCIAEAAERGPGYWLKKYFVQKKLEDKTRGDQ